MIARALIVALIILFPITTFAYEPAPLPVPLKKVLDTVKKHGDKSVIGAELRVFLDADENLSAKRLDIQNGFGTNITLFLSKIPLWNEVLIIIEPAGKNYLKEGDLVFSQGQNIWVTDEFGILFDSAFLNEELELRDLNSEEEEQGFENILTNLERWIRIFYPK